MRVLILLALIGGLVWYGWTAYRPDEEGVAAAEASAEGGAPRGATTDGAAAGTGGRDTGMVAVVPRPDPQEADAPSAAVPPPPSGSSGAAHDEDRVSEAQAGPAPDSAALDPVAPPAGRPSAAESGDGLSLDLGPGRAALVEQGRLLLHDLAGVQALLEPGSGLPDDRKQLLYGLASLVLGEHQAASAVADQIEASRAVTSGEVAFLRAASAGDDAIPRPAAASLRANPLLLGARLGILLREAEEARYAERDREAAEGYSELLRQELRAPWAADREALARWTEHLDVAQAQHRWNRRGTWPSIEVEVRPGDTLTHVRKRVIAERPGMNLCTGLIAAVNQTGEYLQPGQVLRIPTEPARAEVYLSARWVLYLHGDEVLASWPCAIGREGHETPPGKYRAGVKQENPSWMRPGYAPVPYGDPENPLGTRWIAWEGRDGYGFHGTWEPETVGAAASDGCVRMHNQHVERLFDVLPVGAEVDVRP